MSMMDNATAHDIAQRFVDQDANSKTLVNEEENSVDGEGNLFIQLQNVSDDDGDRTYIDLVSYPSDTVNISRVVEMDNVEKIAEAIMEVCEEV